MKLIQILLPLTNNSGRPFPPELYSIVTQELTERFGGLTAFTGAPAEGLWKKTAAHTASDAIVIFEVMSETIDRVWWHHYKTTLESRFSQEELVVRILDIDLI